MKPDPFRIAGPVFFASNIDTPNRMSDISKRIDITKGILRSLDVPPGQAKKQHEDR
jgi:beta-lactamase class D